MDFRPGHLPHLFFLKERESLYKGHHTTSEDTGAVLRDAQMFCSKLDQTVRLYDSRDETEPPHMSQTSRSHVYLIIQRNAKK